MPALRTLNEVVADIKALKIQGARRVARAAVEALVHTAQNSKASAKSELYKELLEASKELEKTRPTEPMMRNSLEDTLRFALAWIRTNKNEDVAQLKKAISSHYLSFLDDMHDSSQKIAKYGAEQIPSGANILIHCHSTTVINLLKKAHEQKKNIRVFCLETRPLFQGRLSARELSEAGIETSLCVDLAAGSIMNKMDLALTGADAITAEGDLINKIGTFSIAQLASLHSVRFFSAAEIYKYDPLTRFGKSEIIEQRDPSEVWGSGLYAKEEQMPNSPDCIRAPKRLRIENFAFDRTPARLVSAYITEEGLIPPAQLAIIAEQKISQPSHAFVNNLAAGKIGKKSNK